MLKKRFQSSFDELWYELLMLLIGDQLSAATNNELNGVIFGRRRYHPENNKVSEYSGRIRAGPKFENFQFRPFELALFC